MSEITLYIHPVLTNQPHCSLTMHGTLVYIVMRKAHYSKTKLR